LDHTVIKNLKQK